MFGRLPETFSIMSTHSSSDAALFFPPPRLYTSPGRGSCAKFQNALITSYEWIWSRTCLPLYPKIV